MYFEAFRVGIDEVPQWFKDINQRNNVQIEINKYGAFVETDSGEFKIADVGDFVRRFPIHGGETTIQYIPKDEFNNLYEPIETYDGTPSEEKKYYKSEKSK